MDNELDFFGCTVADIVSTVADKQPQKDSTDIHTLKQPQKGVVALDAVLATPKTKRQEIVDIFNSLLVDKESVVVSVAKVIELSGLDKKTFHKHLKDIREKEFVLTSKGYGTEIRRRV